MKIRSRRWLGRRKKARTMPPRMKWTWRSWVFPDLGQHTAAVKVPKLLTQVGAGVGAGRERAIRWCPAPLPRKAGAAAGNVVGKVYLTDGFQAGVP